MCAKGDITYILQEIGGALNDRLTEEKKHRGRLGTKIVWMNLKKLWVDDNSGLDHLIKVGKLTPPPPHSTLDFSYGHYLYLPYLCFSLQRSFTLNGGAHLNHSIFWQNLSPNGGGEPSGTLADMIKSAFGSFDVFVEEMCSKTIAIHVSYTLRPVLFARCSYTKW